MSTLNHGFLNKVIQRSSFPKVVDAYNELQKLNFFRIAIGLVVLARTWHSMVSSYYYFDTWTLSSFGNMEINAYFLAALGTMCLLVMFTIGLFTPLATSLLLLTYVQVDLFLGTETLGTNIFILMLLGLLVCGAGSHRSVDAVILNRRPKSLLACFLKKMYSIVGVPNAIQITNVYFMLFLAYALISLGAVLHHFQDSLWLSGKTLAVMFTNSYLSSYYGFFRSFAARFPDTFEVLSAAGSYIQVVFQVFMIPLVFWKPGRIFVSYWGYAFFITCFFTMQLSYLPALELLLWPMILIPSHRFLAIRWRWLSGVSKRLLKHHRSTENDQSNKQKWTNKIYVAGFGISLLLFVGRFPGTLNPNSQVNIAYFEAVRMKLYHIGLDIPLVFNATDLQTGNNWAIIYREDRGGRVLLPLAGSDGERLAYHKSDVLYFGNSSKWRRVVLKQNIKTAHGLDSKLYDFLRKIVRYDYRSNALTGKVNYTVDFYSLVSPAITSNYRTGNFTSEKVHSLIIANIDGR